MLLTHVTWILNIILDSSLISATFSSRTFIDRKSEDSNVKTHNNAFLKQLRTTIYLCSSFHLPRNH